MADLFPTPAMALPEFEQVLAANSGEDPFESAIKLLGAKLFDELHHGKGKAAKFRLWDTAEETYREVTHLYRNAINLWPSLNGSGEELGITPAHLQRAIRPLLGWNLSGSDLSWLDATLERLVARSAKGALGQYFTPREVIRLSVAVLNPAADDLVIDPACGSGGFLFEATQHASKTGKRLPKCLGIDFGAKAVKVATLLAAASPHSRIKISKANSIDGRFNQGDGHPEWSAFLGGKGAGSPKAQRWGEWNRLSASVVLTNPPFAGDISDPEILSAYEAVDTAPKRSKVSREHLFLERCVHMLAAGGRLAIVLPQGLLANASSRYLRSWLFSRCRVLGVIGLHPYAFLPNTSVKTSLLFIQKLQNGERPDRRAEVFFGVSKLPGKDSSGRPQGTSDYDRLGAAFIHFLQRQGVAWHESGNVQAEAAQYVHVPHSEVESSGRLDAEFYDRDTRDLLRQLSKSVKLGSVCQPRIERFKRNSTSKIEYVDISSVDELGIAKTRGMLSSDAPSRASYVVAKGDVLVSTVRPDRNTVGLVTSGADSPIVASNGFCVLRSREVAPEVLFAYCKTDAFKRILSRNATASMYPAVTEADVQEAPFVIPDKKVQSEVTSLVQSGMDAISKGTAQLKAAIELMDKEVQIQAESHGPTRKKG